MKPPYRKIAVPVDGSTSSDRGVRYAIDLARGGGSICFCSVVDPSMLAFAGGAGVCVDFGPELKALEAAAKIACRRAQDRAAAARVPAETTVLDGITVDAIESFARKNEFDAIVIGTRTRRDLERHLFGGVAESLLRCSVVPVMVTHEDDETRSGPIAVAYDASLPAGSALDAAIDLALAREKRIVLIWVFDVASEDRARPALDDATAHVRSYGLDCQIVISHGSPQQSLLTAVDELHCSTIVLGTHGRPFLQRLVLGSVAAHVAAHAHIPVLAVRGNVVDHKPWQRTTASAPAAPPLPDLDLDLLRT